MFVRTGRAVCGSHWSHTELREKRQIAVVFCDLVGSTELATKMVREWGMSSKIGPQAWGSNGQVFLGESLMSSREYSDDTARVIDEEVERILREQEQRCRDTLHEHRNGLDLVARALLERETIDGAEVDRLIQLGREHTADPARESASAD